MKKMIKNLMLVAVAAMGFTACNNENIEEVVRPNDNTYTMTFTAEAPESRTSVTIDGDKAKYSWCENDEIAFIQYAVGADKTNKKKSSTPVIEGSTATFTSNFDTVNGATAYHYGALYPDSSWKSSESFNNVQAQIIASQTLTDGSFDHKADLMMSKPILNATEDGHGGLLQFTRLAAIGKMNLKGVNAGETITKVVITFEDMVVNGNVTLDFESITATYTETGSNTITLKDGALTALEAGTPIFFTCFPGEYVGAYSVEVTTDVATYSTAAGKSIAENKALSFTAGNVTNFNLTVGNRTVSDSKTYTKITNAILADYSGTYLLVYEDGNVAFDGSLATLDAASNTTAVTIDNNSITGAYGAYTFTIAKIDGGYSIKSASGKYIGQTSNANGMLTSDANAYANTISINDGNADIISSGGAYLRFNSSSDSMRFRYYKSSSYTGQKAIALYRQIGTGSDEEIQFVNLATPTNLKATADGKVVTVIWDAVENATNYDVTADGETTNVTTNTATLTLSEYNTDYTISVVAKGGIGYNTSDAATTNVTTGIKPADGELVTTKVTYTVSSTTACTTSGTAPAGSSATYNQTYNTKEQLTSGNSATFTLTGYTGATIKAITLNMKSNSSKGAGTFSANAGSTSLASISTATNFNQWYDNTSYGNTYRDIHVAMINDSYVVQSDENVVITIAATTNSIYIHSVTIDYAIGSSEGGDDNTDEGGDNTDEGEDTEGADITLNFDSITTKCSSYTTTWEQTCGDYSWNMVNFNNNNAGWEFVKCGRKNNASIASIDTRFSIPWAVSSVEVTIDAVTTSKVNSTYLQVATDANFTSLVETINVTIAKGDLTYTITNPGAKYYYRLVYDCASGTSNGLVTISKVVYKAQ